MSKEPNRIQDLRASLFDSMEQLKKGDMDIEHAKAVTNLAQAIIGTAKVEVDFIKAVGGIATGTGFIPLEPQSPNMKGLQSGDEENS